MKISLNWLKDYIEFAPKLSIKDIVWKITEATAEIEKTHQMGDNLETVVVGELLETKKHPEADKLFVGKVKIGKDETIQVIYGDKAVVKKGEKLPTALPGTKLPGGVIKKGKIRGVESEGMFCLNSELIEGGPEDLTRFDKSAKVGTPITNILPLHDTVFDIDNHSITHRVDLFSHIGFARECVALGLAKWKKEMKGKDIEKMTGKKALPVKPVFKSERCTKNYYSTVIENVSTKESPDWMKVRLLDVSLFLVVLRQRLFLSYLPSDEFFLFLQSPQ